MEAKAIARNIRISPRKVRLVLDLIRGKNVTTAFAYLQSTHRGAVPIIRNVLHSAVANAESKESHIDVDSLVVKYAYADAGTTLKRFRAMSMGRGSRINKRTSHITVVVSDGNGD